MIKHFDMELTQRQVSIYKKATKKEKGKILTQYVKLTKIKRDTARKRFNKALRNIYPRALKTKGKRIEKRGREKQYGSIHQEIIKKAWLLTEEICAERLHPILYNLINQLEENHQLKSYEKRYIQETCKVSLGTLKNILSSFPKTNKRKNNKGKTDLYKQIPIHAYFGENANKTGYIEIDYVGHNGGSSQGIFGITGTYVGVFSQWIARAAGLGKNLESVTKIHEINEKKIYHRIYEYHPDNAKPILRLLLKRKLNPNLKTDYLISRSRPYQKQDNGHVEQKNGNKVRELVGYYRYETKEEIDLLNKLYKVEDLISNFFIPSMKLIEKIKDKKGRVVKKKYDKAKTAYQRLIESEQIEKSVKEELNQIYKSLNLIKLRKESDKIKRRLFNQKVSRKKIII